MRVKRNLAYISSEDVDTYHVWRSAKLSYMVDHTAWWHSKTHGQVTEQNPSVSRNQKISGFDVSMTNTMDSIDVIQILQDLFEQDSSLLLDS